MDFWSEVFDRVDTRPASFELEDSQIDVSADGVPPQLRDAVFDTPDWLRSELQPARRFFGATQEGAGEGPGPQVGEAAQPVVMNCPRCAGALEVTGESERTVTCQYCQAAVYLPDPLWQRLHPVQRAEWWFIESSLRIDPRREMGRAIRKMLAEVTRRPAPDQKSS